MRLLKSFAVSLALMVVGATAFAQTRELSGVVLDATDFPLEGVAVIVDGTTNGVMTSGDGSFTLRVPAKDVVLNVSSLGYETKIITVPAAQDNITIHLAEDKMMLEETVVVGYGTQKKVNLTGAFRISSDRPSFREMAKALDLPGMPISSL